MHAGAPCPGCRLVVLHAAPEAFLLTIMTFEGVNPCNFSGKGCACTSNLRDAAADLPRQLPPHASDRPASSLYPVPIVNRRRGEAS